MLDHVPTPLLTLNRAGQISGANRAAVDLFGCRREQLLGTTLAQWSPNVRAIEEFLRGGADQREFDFRLSDGSTRRLAATLAREAGAGEQVLSLFDVTERAVIERNLHEERDCYLDMISAASDRFWESTGASRSEVRTVAPRRKDGTVTMKTLVGRWPDDIADTSYDPEGFAAWQRMHEAHLPYRNIVFHQRRRDGKERYLRSSAAPYHKDGVFQGYRGLSIDVTAQVRAEHALRRSQRHLEHAQSVAAIGSVERDFVTGVEQWSPEMFRILGIERESFERTDENILALIHEDDRARVKAGIERARAGIGVPSAEYRIVRPDGEIRTLYAEADFLSDDAGKPARLLTVFKDVTKLRAAERRHAEAEQQLQHAQKLESIGTLAGGVAHELNNALVPVLALAKLTMQRLPEGGRERANLTMILEGAERARGLMRQILAFSRKEAPTRQSVDLAALVRQSLKMLRASIPRTIGVEERIAAVPPLFGDPAQLHQVVANLVNNAVQAIRLQMGTVTIALAPDEGGRLALDPMRRDATALSLVVTDTGCGMDEPTCERMFEPFFTTRPVGEGTGLGLSVVHGIIAAHGGRIHVESQLGRGTRIEVILPAVANNEVVRFDERERAAS